MRSEKDGSFYIGHTADLQERLKRHNHGKSLYTKSKVPWILMYQEEFLSRSEAMRREREIKGKKNRAYVDYLVRTLQT